MEKPKNEGVWQLRAAKLFCALVGLLGLWWLLKYAAVIPAIFAIAWAVAAVIDPLARKTERRLKLPRKLCAAVYVALLLTLLGVLLFFLISRLLEELRDLLAWARENQAWIGQKIGAWFASAKELSSYLPFMEEAEQVSGLVEFGASVDAMVSGLISETVSGIGSFVTTGVGTVLRATPKLLVLLVVTVMACFYLSMDYVKIRDFVISLLPPRLAARSESFRKKASKAIRSYLRAYVILWLLTFGEVLAGLLILGQPYAFLIAMVVATVDILPILGAGTILIPWAVIMLFLGHHSFGIGLLILYGVLTIVRQIAEPHIVGESLGIHPLASLLCMVLGLQLFGVVGMLLGPAAALMIKEFLVSRKPYENDSA